MLKMLKIKLKTIRIIQIMGLIIGLILTCIGIILIFNARQQLLNSIYPIGTLPPELVVYTHLFFLAFELLKYSIVSIIAGIILFLITTLSLFLIKDNNQNNMILEKKK